MKIWCTCRHETLSLALRDATLANEIPMLISFVDLWTPHPNPTKMPGAIAADTNFGFRLEDGELVFFTKDGADDRSFGPGAEGRRRALAHFFGVISNQQINARKLFETSC